MTAFHLPDTTMLDRLLAEHGSTHTAQSATALLAGILAAPADTDPDRWEELFTAEAPAVLAELRLIKAHLTASPPATQPRMSERLALLRVEMAARGIDGFFIPRADEFQGEYVPASADRLAWISGFTGSAGAAIVLRGSAAFFTDGRYTLQTQAEVDGNLFECYSTAENQPPLETLTPFEWLERHLAAGQVFGIDGWVHTPVDAARLQESIDRAGGSLRLLDDNPLDAAWGAARPPAPLAPVVPHPLSFAGVTSADKRHALGLKLQDKGCHVLAVTLPEDICWLLNIRGGDVPCTPFALSYALAYADGRVQWFIDARKLTPAVHDWLGPDVTIQPPADFATALTEAAAQGHKIWLDPVSAPVQVEALLKKNGATIHTARTPLSLMKACKNPTEIAGTEAAHLRDGVSVVRFLAALAQQSTPAKHDEISAAQLLYDFRKGNEHFRGLSFDTISGAGGNGAIVHYRASEKTAKPLLAGPIYLVDSGAQYCDGTTDITRTLAVDSVDEEMRDRYTRVLKGHLKVSMAVFPAGTTGDVIDALARGPLREAGLDYAHGTGHGVGSYLSVHEGPCSLSPRGTAVPLMPGMIVSNEPGYYKQGAYGIRIENLVLVIDTGNKDAAGQSLLAFRTLTLAPYERALIDVSLLDTSERAWIDTYHARVRDTLLPRLKDIDPLAADYLIAATRPL